MTASAQPTHAAVEIVRRVTQSKKGEIILIALGPLTNVAIAISLEPRLPGGHTTPFLPSFLRSFVPSLSKWIRLTLLTIIISSELLGGLILMGGAVQTYGNVTPVASANMYNDPDAASIVYKVSHLIVVLDCCVCLNRKNH